MMKSRELLYLEAELTSRCGRIVALNQTGSTTLRLVFHPVDDRGRIDLLATHSGDTWTISDRGATANMFDLDVDFLLAKLGDGELEITRDGQAMVVTAREHGFVDAVCAFVNQVEFIPVLAGLWSEDLAAA